MSSQTEKQVDGYSWWERKHQQRAGTYENPALGQVIAGPKNPDYQFATENGSPSPKDYPAKYSPVQDKWSWFQVESDMPETRILSDVKRTPTSEVGMMCPFVGTVSASHL